MFRTEATCKGCACNCPANSFRIKKLALPWVLRTHSSKHDHQLLRLLSKVYFYLSSKTESVNQRSFYAKHASNGLFFRSICIFCHSKRIVETAWSPGTSKMPAIKIWIYHSNQSFVFGLLLNGGSLTYRLIFPSCSVILHFFNSWSGMAY